MKKYIKYILIFIICIGLFFGFKTIFKITEFYAHFGDGFIDDKVIDKNEVIAYVNNNIDMLNKTANDIIAKGDAKDFSLKNIESIYYSKRDSGVNYIDFGYAARGMLGGKYWGFYYTPTDTPIGVRIFEIDFKQIDTGWYWKEPNGNNYYYTERISANWFYYLMDYDYVE